MAQSDLLDIFINALHGKINKKSDLVNFVADSLNIEKESAYRRLNRKVYFSISEMGVLASKLGISIDGILKYKYGYTSPPTYVMYIPKTAQSINDLIEKMRIDAMVLKDLSKGSTECGQTFNSLPIEFVIPYNNLLKFFYFKWGYYFVGSDGFNDFSSWKMPVNLISANETIVDVLKNLSSLTYLWDMSSIWCLAKDIAYFQSIYALTIDDVEVLKYELHRMLYDMEKVAEGISINYFDSTKIQIYISTIHLGMHFTYFISDSKWYSSFHTYFVGSNYSDDHETCTQTRDWMNSMKKVCTLISNSGAKERRLFFGEQHKIVDNIN